MARVCVFVSHTCEREIITRNTMGLLAETSQTRSDSWLLPPSTPAQHFHVHAQLHHKKHFIGCTPTGVRERHPPVGSFFSVTLTRREKNDYIPSQNTEEGAPKQTPFLPSTSIEGLPQNPCPIAKR